MKKLGIIILGLLLSSNAYADEPRVWYKNENTIHIAHKTHFIDWHTDVERVAIAHCSSHDKYMFWVQTTRGGAPINKHYKAKIKSSYKGSWVTEIFCSKERLSYAPNDSFVPGAKIFKTNYVGEEEKRAEEEKQRAEAIASGDITFTINDKKEQCEAIGFTPQTDKFADCVLRLVELDVKSQQANQIALAESQGNQQVADELRKQRNQQGGQYLMDLGQKLLNPPTSKSTTRCTVNTMGGVKTVSCR